MEKKYLIYIFCLFLFIGLSGMSCRNNYKKFPEIIWIADTRYPGEDIQQVDENTIGVSAPNAFLIFNKSNGDLLNAIALSGFSTGRIMLEKNLLYYCTMDNFFLCDDITSGETVWKYHLSAPVQSRPTKDEKNIYFGTVGHVIYAFDKYSGNLKWKFTTGNPVYARPVLKDSLVLIGSWDTFLYAFNKETGHLVWKFGAQAGIDQTPVIIDQAIWLPDYDYRIYALNLQSGQLKYQFTAENAFEFGGAQWKNQFICTGIDRNFYFVDTDQYQVSVRGKSPVAVSCSPVVQGDWLFTGQYDGSLYRWKLPDMEKELLYKFDDRVLAILSDGKYVWVSSWDGALVCLPVNKD
jgi:outer membrane protein assembly factor BamB